MVADTVTRLREVDEQIGATACILIYWCAVLDQPWADTGRTLNRDPHTVRRWTIDAIRLLARAWSSGRRRAGAATAKQSGQRPAAV